MTPASPDLVKATRQALGRLLGRQVSCADLGRALGLRGNQVKDTVRSWEDGSLTPSGPVTVALMFMRQATHMQENFPGFPHMPFHTVQRGAFEAVVRHLFAQ